MESVLPSEIARLVYGYLEAEGCNEAAHSFLETSPHLQECLKVAQEGRKFSTRIHGRTLVQTLDLFFNINSIIQERAEKLNNTPVNNTALSLSVSNNSLVEQLFNLLEGTNTSATNRSSNNNTNTVLLSITVPSQDDTIRVRQHSSGKRRMSVDVDLPKNKEKIQQSSSNVETHKLRKDNITDDDPVIDLSCGEELLTRLLDNTQLHEKIAENINRAICTPEKTAPDNGKDVIQTILKQTEADPLFEQLIKELVGPAEEDSTTPEDTEFEDGHQRSRSEDRKNEDEPGNIKQRLRSAKSKDKSAKDVLEEQNASAVQSILDSCRTKHKKQTDSNSEQVNMDRNESDKENENNKFNTNKSDANCSNLLQTAMINCDINSSPLGTSGERNKSKVGEYLSDESDDHHQPMDLCFIDVTQLSPLPSQQQEEPLSQEKSSMLLIQSDNLATTTATSCASGSQIIIPPNLCSNVVTVQPGYTNVLTVLAPGVTGAAPTLATSTPTIQNKNIPTVLLYEDFLRMQSAHSPISAPTLLQTPSFKQYKPIAPKPAATSENTTVPARSSSVTTNTSVSGTSELGMDRNDIELPNTTVVPIVCTAINTTQIPSTSGPVRRGRGWRRGMKKKLLKRSPKLRKILPRRPPVRSFLNVREQKLVNGVEVKVLDYDVTSEGDTSPLADKKREAVKAEVPEIEVISEEIDIVDDDKKETNVGVVEANNDTNSEKPVAARSTNDLTASHNNNISNDTPELPQSKKGLSLSTPRRKHSHVRALDFNTPLKGTLKRPNTSPKAAYRWSPRKNFLRNAKRSALFKSPASNKSKKKFGSGEITKQQNLSMINESKEQVSVSLKEEMHIPVNGTPRKEAVTSEKSLLPPVATMSPAAKLCGDWGQVNGVELILSSDGKETPKKSWDADLRALAGGQFHDPSPPPKKQLSQKKNCERSSKSKIVSSKNKNERSKLNSDRSKLSKEESVNKKTGGKKNVETKVTAKQTKSQTKVKKPNTKDNKNTKKGKINAKDNKSTKKSRPKGRPPKKRIADDNDEETDTEEKKVVSKRYISSDTESSDTTEEKKESPSKTSEQNSNNEKEKSISSESGVLMVDDSQENLNKNSMSEIEIARQLEENLRQIVGDECSSEKDDQNSVISTEGIRKVLESSKDFVETDKNDEKNKVSSNGDNATDIRKESNDSTDHNITPTNVNNEKLSSKSTLLCILSSDALPVLETPVKLDFVGVVPKTPNLDTPMLKVIRENTSVLSADLLVTPFAQTPLQISSAGIDQTPFKDTSPRNSSNLEQLLIKECCRMEEEIAKKKCTEGEGKILEHNEKMVNSEDKLDKSQKRSVETKKVISNTSSEEMNKIVCVENSDNISVENQNKIVSTENNRNDLQQKNVTISEKKSKDSYEENKSSHVNIAVTHNISESVTETNVEEPFDIPRKGKNNVNRIRPKSKPRTPNRNKSNNKNKINSCEKSDVNMNTNNVDSIRQELMKKARLEIYGESSISSCDFSIFDVKKRKRQRKTKVYPMVYSDDSSVDMPDSKPSKPLKETDKKKNKLNILESSDRSDVESENIERQHKCTSEIQIAMTPVLVDSQKQNKAPDQTASPNDVNKDDELNAVNSEDLSKITCKEKADKCITKVDVRLLEQPKIILTPIKEIHTNQVETSKDNEKTINSDLPEISFNTIALIADTMKALPECSQMHKKGINYEQSSPASGNIYTVAVEVEKPSAVVNSKIDLEKQNENSSDFPPLHLTPEHEDEDDCHSEITLNIVEEDAVLSPAKRLSVLENDLELSCTEPEKRNFPINFVSEIKEYHLTEITFNEANNDDDAAKRKSHGHQVVNNESYEEVYFDESVYRPKPKKAHNIDNIQMNIIVDEDENGVQRYCKLSVQPLQNLFEMRPIEITESSLVGGNLNKKKFLSSDSIIAEKKLDSNVSEKQLEKSAHSTHSQQRHSKDIKYFGRSPSSTKSEYSISRPRMSEPSRNWRASSTKTMLVTRTVDGRKRIAPVKLDDYDYERRQRRRYEDSERRKSSDRQRERDRDRDRESERVRDRESDRYRESERYRDRDRDFDRDRESERYRDRDRESDRYRERDFERYRDRELDRSRDRDRALDRSRDRELERECYRENDKHRDGEREIFKQRDSDRSRYREIDRDTHRARSRDRTRSREKDKNIVEDLNREDNEVRSRQDSDFVRGRSRERRKSDVEVETGISTRELNESRCLETSEVLHKGELIKYDEMHSHKSSDIEEGQCTDPDDEDDLMNQVIISKTLSPRKKNKEKADHSTVESPNKLPPKKRKASDDISLGPFKIARTEEPQALLKKVDLEKFLTAVHGDDASTSDHQRDT